MTQPDFEIGRTAMSDWMVVDQSRVDRFADATEDRDRMHIDPDWCRENSPYRGTIVFGFLTLSLLTHFSHEVKPWPDGVFGLNYGFNRIRFLAPVRVGARIRAVFTLKAVQQKGPGQWLTTSDVAVEVEGGGKPALVAEWLGMMVSHELAATMIPGLKS